MTTTNPPTALEAKIVVLGSQGVGKTSLVSRFISPPSPFISHPSTVGASFATKRVLDPDTATTVRLQIWDTAGQERFRSISRLYYRGADAGLLCYDITDEKSWEDMKSWLSELKAQCGQEEAGEELVVHVVGTKSDIVAEDPTRRKVPFEKTIAYVAEQLFPTQTSTPPSTNTVTHASSMNGGGGFMSPDSKGSSGFWGQDVGWDSCHEVNARDGEGIEEVFRVIARKLVEQRNRRLEREAVMSAAMTPYSEGGKDYFNGSHGSRSTAGKGSFRVGYGDKRRSWLGLPSVGLGVAEGGGTVYERSPEKAMRKGRCC